MKTEHEKLKEICDEIGYIIPQTDFYGNGKVNDYSDVREIIFTPEFIVKLQVYLHNKKLGFTWNKNALLEHLEAPVDYLYNLLELGNQ